MKNPIQTLRILYDMEASEPKWVNSVLNIIEVNSLRLGGLYIITHNISQIKEVKRFFIKNSNHSEHKNGQTWWFVWRGCLLCCCWRVVVSWFGRCWGMGGLHCVHRRAVVNKTPTLPPINTPRTVTLMITSRFGC